MNDGQRVYPVNIFVLHHSTGPRFADTADITIQDWFSEVGKARGYSNGAIASNHEHPSRPGTMTYSMAQFAGSPDSSNKYNYKLTDLMQRPWGNVAWHAGDWNINVHSCGLENCGNFMDMILENRQLLCIADFLRGIDQELVAGGYPGGLTVMLHQEIFATACPGRIKEQRDTIVDMINNPAKWNAIVFPVVDNSAAIAAAKAEAIRLAAVKAEAERLAAVAETARLAKIEAEKLIAAKIAADKLEAEKIAAAKLLAEQEAIDKIAKEAAAKAAEKAKQEAVDKAKADALVVQKSDATIFAAWWRAFQTIINEFITNFRKGK